VFLFFLLLESQFYNYLLIFQSTDFSLLLISIESQEKYLEWLFDLDRALVSLISNKRSRVAREELMKERDSKDVILLDSICFSSIIGIIH
jgi:hypothetical protein